MNFSFHDYLHDCFEDDLQLDQQVEVFFPALNTLLLRTRVFYPGRIPLWHNILHIALDLDTDLLDTQDLHLGFLLIYKK